MKSKSIIYIVSRRSNRKDYPTIEDQNCYIGTTLEQCIDWIKKNKNYADHNNYWWWTVYSGKINSEQKITTTRYFDWDGEVLKFEPLGMELHFTRDFSRTKVGDILYDYHGNKYPVQAITAYKKHIWSNGNPIVSVLPETSDSKIKYARLIPTSER